MKFTEEQILIYRNMIISSIENMKNYIEGTKGDDWNKYRPWAELLDECEGLEDELLALIEFLPKEKTQSSEEVKP